MDWIKRNLFLVISAIVAVGLLGFGGYYLYTNQEEDKRVNLELDQAIAELQTLHNANPTPNATNIAILTREQRRLDTFITDLRQRFNAPPEVRLDNPSFRKLIDDTVFELVREADNARVALPRKDYGFTFDIQRRAVKFAPGSIEPLVARMEEVKSLCAVVFNARVHSLDGLRRVSVSSDDTEGSADFLLQKPLTNSVVNMLEIPYEVTFTGFSAQLASVFDGLQRGPHFFLVKNVTVEPAPMSSTGNVPGGVAAPMPAPTPAVVGEGAPPAPSAAVYQAPGAKPGATAKAGPVTLLDEKLLRITLLLNVVVPLPAAPAAPGAAAPK